LQSEEVAVTDNIHDLFDKYLQELPTSDTSAEQPSYSDEELAHRLTARYGETLRYVRDWGHWLIWDAGRYKEDNTLKVMDLCREIAREAAREAAATGKKPNLIRSMKSSASIHAIENLARSDRQHASIPEEWDADEWLLNTPGGTVNLRNGQIRPSDPVDMLTKQTAVTPEGDCPLWKAFLEKVFNSNAELIAYVQRVLGYCLTGSTREHALFFCHGTGGNGKGILLNTFSAILGDYSATAPMTTFTASQSERHPTELAMLRGARTVTSQETEAGQRWPESKIKACTGGDMISARFMRQDFFEFRPQFKLLIAGNHKPSLTSVDEALRRRFNLIPFTVTIPPSERDPDLFEKLKKEWPGILAWAIEGCLQWQREGLAPPQIVLNATAEYFDGEDAFGRFISEKCDVRAEYSADLSLLYSCFKKWCSESGEEEISLKRFSQNLTDRKFKKKKDSRTRRERIFGLSVRTESMSIEESLKREMFGS
jgi:putative DNA primase/helicase